MKITKYIPLCSLILLFWSAGSNATTPGEEIEKRRNDLKSDIQQYNIGSSYAQILSIFTDPGISASSFDVDDDENTSLEIYKFPLQKNVSLGSAGWELALRGLLSYSTLATTDNIANQAIDSKWKAYSGSIGTGLRIPVFAGFKLLAAADIGLSHMKNDATYLSSGSVSIIPLALEGILFNWDTDAWIGSLIFGFNYEHLFANKYDLDVKGSYTYSHISSFNGSNDFQSFAGNAQTISLSADFTHPLGFSIADYPLSGVAHLGDTHFLGNNRDTLGFDSFVELGYSLKMDLNHLGFYVDSLRLGYQWNIGENVKGQTILFGIDFSVF